MKANPLNTADVIVSQLLVRNAIKLLQNVVEAEATKGETEFTTSAAAVIADLQPLLAKHKQLIREISGSDQVADVFEDWSADIMFYDAVDNMIDHLLTML